MEHAEEKAMQRLLIAGEKWLGVVNGSVDGRNREWRLYLGEILVELATACPEA